MIEQFYKLPKRVLMAEGWVSPLTGEMIALSLSDKMVYVVLKSRNEYFLSFGKDHFDTQEDIANMCGTSRKKAGVFLQRLIKEGVVGAKKGFRGNWIYTNVGELTLYGKVLSDYDEKIKLSLLQAPWE